MLELFDYQKLASSQLKTGSILCGGVGSGKSLTAIYYYYTVECGGIIDEKRNFFSLPLRPKDLFIITTVKKRDSLDWERECVPFMISKDRLASIGGIKLTVDSWNNIKKYIGIKNSFFIFDEQRVIGSGSWVKSFLKITKSNNWILLSATPGDTWMDYIPVFIANGFYENRTEFIRQHVVYNNYYNRFSKVDHYIGEKRLEKMKQKILVYMNYKKPTVQVFRNILVPFDKEKYDIAMERRWNPFTNRPIKDIGEFCNVLRKIVNTDSKRLEIIRDIFNKHRKIIIFYNFDYELEILKNFCKDNNFIMAEYNGHKHEPLPKTESWIYLVQYISGSEGWNCIETNTVIFYSLNYSYRLMTQAAGRIDRLNTPFLKLYYYSIKTNSTIDLSIGKALKNKKDFNEKSFMKSHEKHML